MTKIHVISGFLGAGKTTLIKKLIAEAFKGQKVVLIENEFGEIGIDGGFLKDAGIEITEMNSGCICCSLVGDFSKALGEVLEQFTPDHILIEPSGVGKLSDVVGAIAGIAEDHDVILGGSVTVADANKCKMYMKNFGEFYNNQVENARTIILSRTQKMSQEKLEACVALLREHNADANIITTPWDELGGDKILAVIEREDDMAAAMLKAAMEEQHHHHHEHDEHCECGCHDHDHEHHHHHEHDEHCECGCHDHDHEHHHHHDHDEHCECGCHDHDHEHHHHHEHDEHCECGCHDHDHEHHHHHEHDEHCECGCHDHDHEHHHHEHDEHCECGCHDHDHHHHHHHADEVFTSWGVETPRKYTMEEVQNALAALNDDERCGVVLRAKGIVPAVDGSWIHFDFVPEESNVRTGAAEYTGRLCVIGAQLKEDALKELFCL